MIPEPPPGSIVTWFAQFRPNGRIYQYAAVHILGRGWFTTSARLGAPLDWPTLVFLIGPSPAYVGMTYALISPAPANAHVRTNPMEVSG